MSGGGSPDLSNRSGDDIDVVVMVRGLETAVTAESRKWVEPAV